MTDRHDRLPAAFYARSAGGVPSPVRDWWLLLHPPYTLWHLSYVVVGGCLARAVDGARLGATVLAFFLAVGIGAHALDELHGRPLGTSIPRWVLVSAAAASLAGAVGLGLVGVFRVGGGLVVFIVVGLALTLAYNLELVGGHLHNDATFGAAWGAFPVLAAYYTQAETLDLPALAAATAAFGLSWTQRRLSTPARMLRRRAAVVGGRIVLDDGRVIALDARTLLAPLEAALRALSWSMVALAAALAVARLTSW